MADACAACIFWDRYPDYKHGKFVGWWDPKWVETGASTPAPDGICHRFPRSIYKDANDWCGEFIEAANNTESEATTANPS